jgi:putative serine protease PepD
VADDDAVALGQDRAMPNVFIRRHAVAALAPMLAAAAVLEGCGSDTDGSAGIPQGIVSSVNRSVGESNGVTLSDAIQTSAEIHPGDSGGALVERSGRVIGIPTLAALDPEFGDAQAPGICFAIPSNGVRRVAGRLLGQAE